VNSRNPAASRAISHRDRGPRLRAITQTASSVVGTDDPERAVLRLLSTRPSNRETGRELYVSVNTVRSQVQAIYRKLEVSTRAEAVARARHLRLLPGSTPSDR
jgi:ATP/maltotriose-dependent transcriptional regulator MalT